MTQSPLGKNQSAGILSVVEWPAQSPDHNPIEHLDRMVHKKCPSSQSNLWEVLQEAWGEGQNLFQIKIIISNRVNVLTIFSIHFATHLMNKSVSFDGKHEIVWVTPNFWTVVYIYRQARDDPNYIYRQARKDPNYIYRQAHRCFGNLIQTSLQPLRVWKEKDKKHKLRGEHWAEVSYDARSHDTRDWIEHGLFKDPLLKRLYRQHAYWISHTTHITKSIEIHINLH